MVRLDLKHSALSRLSKSTHALDHPPSLALEHLAPLYPTLPCPEHGLERKVPGHGYPEDRLGSLKVDIIGIGRGSEREENRRVAQCEVNGRVQEGRSECLIQEVLWGQCGGHTDCGC
jgi:hypothetical protein